MWPDEQMHDTHEYCCGRGLFYDLECSCWDGPRVTEQDLRERAAGGEAKARYEPLNMTVANPKVLPLK